jgi:hypothetical protein
MGVLEVDEGSSDWSLLGYRVLWRSGFWRLSGVIVARRVRLGLLRFRDDRSTAAHGNHHS